MGNTANYGSEQFFMCPMFMTECFHNKCLNCQPCVQFIFSPGCELDMILSVMTQTLDGILVNQPRHFLLLAKEAKRIAEEIRIEKINEQWAGIPRDQLLDQSFKDQLNSIQILEQLAPLQLAKEHLPGNIIDILERLGKADHIPHNQLYYIVENWADCYYSKVIETFVALLKWQLADRQLLLVNTARSLKFLEEYTDRQALIWQIF